MRLSDQALGAIMLALQNSLMNQTDIVPILKGFELSLNSKEEITVNNPPIVDSKQTNEGFNFEESQTTVGSD